MNRASCLRPRPDDTETDQGPEAGHRAPDELCRCGFYGYGRSDYAVAQQPAARRVLAVIAASGTVIAGTRGIRAEHARIEALWLSRRISGEIVRRISARYPGAQIYRDRDRMLAEHPPTVLDCYQPWPSRGAIALWSAATALGFAAGLVPTLSPHSPLRLLLLLMLLIQLLITSVTLGDHWRPEACAVVAATGLWAFSTAEPVPLGQAALRLPLIVILAVLAVRALRRRARPAR